MDMRYSRFLFEEINGCMVFYGEFTNPDTKERIRIFYLRESTEADKQNQKSSLFLCPKHVDLVVLGQNTTITRKAWETLSWYSDADVLVMEGEGFRRRMPSVREVVTLNKRNRVYCMRQSGWEVVTEFLKSGSVLITFHAERVCQRGFVLQKISQKDHLLYRLAEHPECGKMMIH